MQLTPEQTIFIAVITSAGFAGFIQILGRWLAARNKIAVENTKLISALSTSDREEIYKILRDCQTKAEFAQKEAADLRVEVGRLKATVDTQAINLSNNAIEIRLLHSLLDKSNAEITRLRAVIVWYKAQAEKQGSKFDDLPFDLTQGDFS